MPQTFFIVLNPSAKFSQGKFKVGFFGVYFFTSFFFLIQRDHAPSVPCKLFWWYCRNFITLCSMPLCTVCSSLENGGAKPSFGIAFGGQSLQLCGVAAMVDSWWKWKTKEFWPSVPSVECSTGVKQVASEQKLLEFSLSPISLWFSALIQWRSFWGPLCSSDLCCVLWCLQRDVTLCLSCKLTLLTQLGSSFCKLGLQHS